jgi:superfamily II DNA or RNA helicase
MRAVITNKLTVIENPSTEMESFLTEQLTYTDKSKQYQISRMSKSPFLRKSAAYKKLLNESEGCILKKHPAGHLLIPSGVSYLLEGFPLQIEDKRTTTGITVPLPWINKPYDLRDYQEEAVQLMENNYRGIINFATGLGKTLLSIHTIKRLRVRTLIVCPTDNVAKMFYNDLVKAFGSNKVGFYGDNKKKINDITVGIAASVTKDTDIFAKHGLGLIIFDEVHHIAATTFYSIMSALSDIGKMFGLTATDYRSDGKDVMIHAGCGRVLVRRDIKWGIANGWLAEPLFIIRKVKTGGRDIKGDKLKNYREHVLNSQIMKDQIRNDLQSAMELGKYILCLVDEVAHGVELANELGIPFATGKDSKSNDYVDALNDGKIPGLVGTDGKIGEGTDTRNVDVVSLANFVVSEGPLTQCIGRGLRKQGTKTVCIFLDYIPVDSKMLTRHAMGRIKIYKKITDKVKII